MELGQLANIGEFIGGVAVIASLLFLGLQIRKGTHAMRVSTYREVSEGMLNSLSPAMSDGELAGIVLRGLADLQRLDAVERYRFDLLFLGWLLQFEQALLANEEGIYPRKHLRPLRAAVGAWMGTPGGSAWWEERRVWFEDLTQREVYQALTDDSLSRDAAGPRLNTPPPDIV